VKQSLQVSILGQQFHLRSDSSPEQVQRVAGFVEEQIREVTASGRVADTLQASILALLNVSARYLQGGGTAQGLPMEAVERLEKLALRIERVLGEPR
jgi:cell division protein ZapA (FtsZ GTPase activity inhibitor)